MFRSNNNQNNRRNRKSRKLMRKSANRRGVVRVQTIGTKRNCVPDRLRTTLTVTTFANYSFITNNFSKAYTGNNLKDPWIGDFNSQPIGYVEFITFYQKYVVLSSSIQLEIVNGSSDVAISGIWFALYPSRTSTPIGSTVIDAAAQPYVKNGYVGSPVAANKVTIRHSITTARLLGKNPRFDDDFAGDASTNPAIPWFWVLFMSGIDNDPLFPTVQVLIKINYLVEFYDRNTIPMPLTSLNNQVPSPFSSSKKKQQNEESKLDSKTDDDTYLLPDKLWATHQAFLGARHVSCSSCKQ